VVTIPTRVAFLSSEKQMSAAAAVPDRRWDAGGVRRPA
jgi:hypothetical protein